MTRAMLLALALAAACARPPAVGRARFVNAPPVTRVDDRRDVPAPPRRRPFDIRVHAIESLVYRRVLGALSPAAPRRALDINAHDEVPDSTWFERRIARVTPADLRRGPGVGGPDRSTPWTVVSLKAGGAAAGFVIRDGRGDRWIVKFDQPGFPVAETAADVIVQRLLWALGYHVPEDQIAYLDEDELVLDPDAAVTWADVRAQLADAHRGPDGRWRVLVSRFVPGVPLGGFPEQGVRADDPNDTIPHEHRRSLRALRVFLAWVSHTDLKEDNTLDAWVEEDGRRFVRHYLVDFGMSLGVRGLVDAFPGDGHAWGVDLDLTVRGLVGLGLVVKPYERTAPAPYPGVGRFDARSYAPAAWRPFFPWTPMFHLDAADRFWAGRVLAQVSEAHVRAAVEAGAHEDPRAIDYLVDVLVERRRRTLAWAYAGITTLDELAVERGALTGVDRWIADGLGAPAATTFAAVAFDHAGAALDWRAAASPDAAGRVRFADVPAGPSHDGYAIVRVEATRDGAALAAVEVHLARGPDGAPRVVGIVR